MRATALAGLLLTIAAAVMSRLDAPHGLALRAANGSSVSSGYLFVDKAGDLEWVAGPSGPERVIVDTRAAASPLALERGPHLIEIAYESDVMPVLGWRDPGAHVSRPVSASAFAPVRVRAWRWYLRAARPWIGLAAATIWTLFLMALAWRGLTRMLPGPALVMDKTMRILFAVSALAMLAGIGWGWPLQGWAPDEMWPSQVVDALARRFTGGWFDLYPPGHFYVLSLLYSPLLLLQAAGWLPVDGVARDAALHMLSRFASVGMALGILALIARFATQLGGRQYAWPAALCASASLPFVFYTRLVNVDVPYLFWFCLSLLWFHACVTNPRVRNGVAFAATGMMAVITKDQAYALYVLPALWLAWRLARSPGGLAILAATGATAAAVFVLGHNVLFNAYGFSQHMASITGGASVPYRMVPTGVGGIPKLATILASQLWWVLGVPGLFLCLAGIWFHRATPWIPRWVWLFPCSYLLFFVAVVGYSFDRFLMPVALVLGLLGGAGLRGLLATGRPPGLSRAMATVCVAWLVWRVVSVDALQMLDSRYAAETWLEANVPRGAVVGTPWQVGYLPRLGSFQHRKLEVSPESMREAGPAFVVVNMDFMSRYRDGAPLRRWLQWMASPEAPYQEVYRFKRNLWWTELGWWPLFRDRVGFTNLDKANPEIVVYARSASRH